MGTVKEEAQKTDTGGSCVIDYRGVPWKAALDALA